MTSVGSSPEMALLGCTGPMDSVIISNILDSMSDSLVVIGEDGEFLYVNKVTESILGYGLSDFRKRGLGELFFATEENRDFKQIFLDALWKKNIKNYREVDYHHPDGSVKRLAATTSYLLVQGEVETAFIGFVALFKDITEIFNLRRVEEALKLEKERIDREKITSLQKLAMGVAHEIRNPTVTIGGFAARIARDEKNPEETRRYARNILEDARRLEVLVKDVQEYCDLPESKFSRGSVSELVENVVAELAPLGMERNIAFRVVTRTPPGHEVGFDPGLLKAAFQRLVRNAVDFSQDGSTVDISVYIEDQGTVLEVRDYGIGIKAEDREYVFNPFFSTQVHGTGMGLAVVERVVHEHMGKIEVKSEPGSGTSMRIIIPNVLSAPTPV
jgi:PAS domain S-box-containing protein